MFDVGDVDSGHDGEKNRLDVARQEKLDNFTHYKRVSDYLLGKTIGEGSFARVRLGLHVHTAHEVYEKQDVEGLSIQNKTDLEFPQILNLHHCNE